MPRATDILLEAPKRGRPEIMDSEWWFLIIHDFWLIIRLVVELPLSKQLLIDAALKGFAAHINGFIKMRGISSNDNQDLLAYFFWAKIDESEHAFTSGFGLNTGFVLNPILRTASNIRTQSQNRSQ